MTFAERRIVFVQWKLAAAMNNCIISIKATDKEFCVPASFCLSVYEALESYQTHSTIFWIKKTMLKYSDVMSESEQQNVFYWYEKFKSIKNVNA